MEINSRWLRWGGEKLLITNTHGQSFVFRVVLKPCRFGQTALGVDVECGRRWKQIGWLTESGRLRFSTSPELRPDSSMGWFAAFGNVCLIVSGQKKLPTGWKLEAVKS